MSAAISTLNLRLNEVRDIKKLNILDISWSINRVPLIGVALHKVGLNCTELKLQISLHDSQQIQRTIVGL
jgi:hypothetical protein